MKSLSMLMIALSLFAANVAAADDNAAARRPAPQAHAAAAAAAGRAATGRTVKVAKASCEQLMTFDQATTPQSVYFSQGRVRCERRGG